MRVMQFSATRVRLRYAAIAGVVVVVAVLWMTMRPVNETPQPVRAVPNERLSKAEEFAWEGPFAAARYRCYQPRHSAGDGCLHRGGERIALPARIGTCDHSGGPVRRYSWEGGSLDANGKVIAQSVPITFLYEP